MARFPTKLIALAALPVAALIAFAPTPAQAQWRGGYGGGYGGYGGGRGGYGGGYYGHRGWGPGPVIGGAILGLGVGALLAAPYLAPPPPVVYAPPPPAYYPPPAYAYAPPAYYRPY